MASLQRMRSVMGDMSGKHFHEHLHVMDDVMEETDMKNVHYLEIGSYHGCSAAFISSNPRVKKITAVDPMVFQRQEDVFWENVNRFKLPGVDVSLVKKRSFDVDVSKIPPVDLLLIDGCHKFKTVVKDFDLYSPLVKSGGYIFFDDYLDAKNSPQVRKAVDHLVVTRIAAEGEFEIVGTRDNAVGAFPDLGRNNTFILKKL